MAACLLAASRSAADPVWAGQCGIRAQQTVWAEYGWPGLLPILARPGTLLAVTQQKGSDYAAQARARGATTYAFDLHFRDRVGTPSAPADPSTIEASAEQEYQKAVTRSGGCATPLVVENELFGAGAPTPWTPSIVQYRSNVLGFLRDLSALGAHPVLLISREPFTGSTEAAGWWREVAQVADIVREDYVPATAVWGLGPVLGNRTLRQRYREAVLGLTSIGIPASRLGIMLSFLSAKGGGGRSGLEPASAWYQVVKWDALSAKTVARELGLGSVFSWGWQQWNRREVDPDKAKAACVWLWARNRNLCNAPRMLGHGFDRSLVRGQIVLRSGAFCRVPGLGSIGIGAVGRLEALTGDRDAALSALFGRLVESRYAGGSRKAVLAAERAVIRASFHGSGAAYRAALEQAHATVPLARAVLGDELRQARIERWLRIGRPTGREISGFYASYPQLLVRRVHVSPAPAWLGGKHEGFALSGTAPDPLFSAPSGRKSRIETLLGKYTVKPLGEPVQLGSLPLSAARPAIAAALRGFARAHAFERWTISRQRSTLAVATCQRDELPQPAAIDLTQYLPFLRIN